MTIRTKRVYDPSESEDGFRALIDRLWPRGIKKEDLKLDAWFKDIAPSDSLRKWFGHDPSKWEEFKTRYFLELDLKPDGLAELLEKSGSGPVTILYSAHDEAHNNAVALKAYIESRTPERQDSLTPWDA